MEDRLSLPPLEVFTALDLEMNKPSGRIIQIGACAGNVRTGKLLGTFSAFVDPGEPIDPFITDLTKITDEDVLGGASLSSAYRELSDFHRSHGSFINPITWGGGDSQVLLAQLVDPRLDGSKREVDWCFGRRWIDAKTLFVSWRVANGQSIQGGLGRSLVKLGLKFEGQKHNAEDDAVNAFRAYCALLRLLRTA